MASVLPNRKTGAVATLNNKSFISEKIQTV
jgi:hypothetical protein